MPNPHYDSVDNRILEAAGVVLAKSGYTKATMRSIANKAGVSISTLYHRFNSKQHLLSSILESVWQDLADGALSIENDAQMDPLEKVDAVIDLFIETFKKRPQRALVFIHNHISLMQSENDSIKAHYLHFINALTQIIRSGIKNSYINTRISPETFTFYLYGGMRALLHEWALQPKHMRLDKLSAGIKFQVKHGILHW